MRGFHFSLRWLFGVVSFLAVGCGLLIYASPFLSKLTFTTAIVALLAAVLLAVYHAGDRRGFWAGFAAFGLTYLWLICGAWQSPDGSTPLRERLITSDLLSRCHEVLPARQASVSLTPAPVYPGSATYAVSVAYDASGNLVPTTMMPGGGSMPYGPTMTSALLTTTIDRSDFFTTGHSLFAILFAFLGGVIATLAYRRAQIARTAAAT